MGNDALELLLLGGVAFVGLGLYDMYKGAEKVNQFNEDIVGSVTGMFNPDDINTAWLWLTAPLRGW